MHGELKESCMETDYFAAIPIAVLSGVIAVFVWIYRRKDRSHPAEAGKAPIFTEACGGVVGWLNYKGPFIRVAVYPDFLVVSCDRQYYLPFSSVGHIERRNFFFSKGYRIHHRTAEYPKRIELWLSGREKFETSIAGKVQLK